MTEQNQQLQKLQDFGADIQVQVTVKMEWPELTAEKTLELMEAQILNGVTIQQLKERSGLHINTINNLKNGRKVGPDSLIKLLYAMGHTVRIAV